jgi:hypothetical protein
MTLNPKLDPTCVLCLPWGEAGGSTAYDQSQYGYNGTIYGAARTSGKPRWALSFDGVDDYVVIGDVCGFEGTAPYSVTLWVFDRGYDGYWKFLVDKRTATPSTEGWNVARDATANSYRMERWVDGVLDAVVFNYTPNRWNFIAFTYDGSRMKGYLNGSLMATTPSTKSLKPTGTPLTIGKKSVGTGYFNGLIGEVRIYSRALSDKEIYTLYVYGLESLRKAPPLRGGGLEW